MGMSELILLIGGGALLGTGAMVFGGIFVLVSSKKKRLGASLLAVGLLMGVSQACVFLWSLKPIIPAAQGQAITLDDFIEPISEEPIHPDFNP